jgi:hypothetical protein
MKPEEARAVLDLARAGGNVTRYAITRALLATGELTPFARRQITKLDGQDRARERYRASMAARKAA